MKEILEEFKLECALKRLTPPDNQRVLQQFLSWLEKQHGIMELEDIRSTHIKMYMQFQIRSKKRLCAPP